MNITTVVSETLNADTWLSVLAMFRADWVFSIHLASLGARVCALHNGKYNL